MPKIPKFKGGGGISLDVPRPAAPSIEQAGMVHRAKSKLIDQVGSLAAQLEQRRTLAKRNEYRKQTSHEMNKFLMDSESANENSFRGTNYEGFSNIMEDEYKQKMESVLENAPDNKIREEMQFKLQETLLNKSASWKNFENKKASAFYLSQDAARLDDLEASIAENPNVATTVQAIRDMRNNLAADAKTIYSQEQVNAINGKIDKIGSSVFESMLANGGGYLKQGIDLLDGKVKDEYSQELVKNIDPKQKRILKGMFERRLKQEQSNEISSILDGLENIAAKAELDGGMSKNTLDKLDQMDKALDRFPQSTEIIEKRNQVKNKIETVKFKNNMKHMAIDEIMAIDPRKGISTNHLMEAKDDLKTWHERQGVISDYLKESMKDPGAIINREYKNVPIGSKQFYNIQEVRGFSNPQYLPKGVMDMELDVLVNSPNKMNDLEEYLGKYEKSLEALNQASNENKAAIPFIMAAEAVSPQTKKLYLQTNDAEIKKNFQAVHGNRGNDFDAQINNIADPYFKAFKGNDAMINFTREKIKTKARQLMMPPFNLDLKDASQEAYNSTIGKDYHIVQAGDVHLPLKKNKINERQKDFIQTFVSSSLDPAYIDSTVKSLGISAKANGWDGDDNEFFKETIDDMSFEMSSSREGINLVYKRADGSKQIVRNTQGKPIFVKFNDIADNHGKYNQMTLKRTGDMNSFLKGSIGNFIKRRTENIKSGITTFEEVFKPTEETKQNIKEQIKQRYKK